MGVPKFYRWMSERYPCLSEVVKEYQIPEFDNLYLDMNGIIHPCSHPEDDNPHFRITEEQIFKNIFHYIEVLFRMIKPKKVFFMAVDGVAPRAKMNQQRGRRFRSAKEAENLEKQALAKGETLPTEKRFDSNCITPGTPFMVRLQEQLKYFVTMKMSTDKMWQGRRVILSGHETPGEGEHKVMDFIRSEKTKDNYDPNTRHCLYGLDADLIMLGLASHEPHFSLLREEVKFGGKNAQKKSSAPEETTFHLLHLSLMREYLDFEFGSLKKRLPFAYDLEKIIDDWILMGFLVGNDFIPHLPNIHIHQEALPQLWKAYLDVMPTLDGYLNENGELHLGRFEKYVTEVSKIDRESFSEQYADSKWLESKVAARKVKQELGKAADKKLRKREKALENFDGILGANAFYSLTEEMDINEALTNQENDEDDDDDEDDEDEALDCDDDFEEEFRKYKNCYYTEKMLYPSVTDEVLQEQTKCYVEALQWILYYYFNGVPSWSWFYPHHYAPYISDVRNFADLKLKYDYAEPFLPFQQLMAVLPTASRALLPEAFQSLMTDQNSPIYEFYPTDFDSDLNGKQQEWEAVVLIPFIEESRLISAMENQIKRLTPEEKSRNIHGPHLLFVYSEEVQNPYPSSLPNAFPDITNNHARCTELPKTAHVISKDKLFRGLCKGVAQDVYFPGFPTFKHIKHAAHLKKAGVKVFQQPSRGDNMVLKLEPSPDLDVEQVAHSILNKSLYAAWPHLVEVKVTEVSDCENRFTRSGKDMVVMAMNEEEQVAWCREIQLIKNQYYDRKGVEIDQTSILIRARPMNGRKYICGSHGNITLEKQYETLSVPYAYQTCVKDIAAHAPTFTQYKTLDDLFSLKSAVFMLGHPHYGSMGEVVAIDPKNKGRISISITSSDDPNPEQMKRMAKGLSFTYLPGFRAAQQLGISSHLLSRMTGTLFVMRGHRDTLNNDKRVNVGLNLKFNKTNEEVAGYTRKNEKGWFYSQTLVEEMSEYIEKFPELFEHLNANLNEDNNYECEIFPDNSPDRLTELSKFLKQLPCRQALKVTQGSKILEKPVVNELCKFLDVPSTTKSVKMQVKPHLLYRPLEAQMTLVPDKSVTFELFDRIINSRDGYSVPLGLKGLVIGIHPSEKDQDWMYDILFDEEFPGALKIRCDTTRVYRLPSYAMINISHGIRKNSRGKQPLQPRDERNAQQPNHHQNRNLNSSKDSWRSASHSQSRQSGLLEVVSSSRSASHRKDFSEPRQSGLVEVVSSGRSASHRKDFSEPRQSGLVEVVSSGRSARHQKKDDAAAQLWQTLGMKNEDKGRKQKKPSSAKNGGSGPSLSQAALSLPKAGLNQVSSQETPSTSEQPAFNINNFFKKVPPQPLPATNAENVPQTARSNQLLDGNEAPPISHEAMVIGQATANEINEEFRSMFNMMMRQPEQHSSEEGTEAIQRMLNIAPSTGESKNSVEEGKHFSAQQFFQDVKQKQKQQSATEQQNIAPVTKLRKRCQAAGIPYPQYTPTSLPDGKYIYLVTMPNNRRFQGSATSNKDQALQSAAAVADMTLTWKDLEDMANTPHQQPPPGGAVQTQRSSGRKQGGHHGGFASSPNSAFTPVKSGRQGDDMSEAPQHGGGHQHGGPPLHGGGPHHGGPPRPPHHEPHFNRPPTFYPPQGHLPRQHGHHMHPRMHGGHPKPPGHQGGFFLGQGGPHHRHPGHHGHPQHGFMHHPQQAWSVHRHQAHGGSTVGPSHNQHPRDGAKQPGTTGEEAINPFVPLQVQRKHQKSGKKSGQGHQGSEKTVENFDATVKQNVAEKNASNAKTNGSAHDVGQTGQTPGGTGAKKADRQRESRKGNSSTRGRRPKPRLAANFGSTPN